MQIIVLGTHRSGTSLITRLINMMGAYFGVGDSSIGFNADNPKGFWERRDVVTCNDELLGTAGCSWDQLAGWKLEDTSKRLAETPPELARKIKSIVLELDANRPWVVKDPRLCLTFPYWRPHLEMPVAVVMSRDPIEVALSLKKRNGFSLAHGLAVWEYYTAGIIDGIGGLPAVIHVSHGEVLADPYDCVQRVHDAFAAKGVRGLRLPSRQEVESFIEPSLYQSKKGNYSRETLVTPHMEKLYAILQGKTPLPAQGLAPSELARDQMLFYKDGLEKEARSSEINRNFAAVSQQCAQMHNEAQQIQERHAREVKVLEDKWRKTEARLRDMEQSTSWKIGHRLARLFHTMTFRRSL